jgi:hypothetical protein
MATPISVKSYGAGYVVTFDTDISQNDAERYFFEDGVPPGVELIAHGGREYALQHLGVEAAKHMRQGVFEWIVTANEPVGSSDWFPGRTDNHLDGGHSGTGKVRPPGFPPLGDEAALKEWFKTALEGAHYIGGVADVVEAFGGAGALEFLGIAGEFLGPVGEVASLVLIYVAVIEAFSEGRKERKRTGYSYGMCWEAFGEPDHDKVFYPWAGDSADELREAFFDGVHEGREKARDPKLHNALVLLAARYELSGVDGWAARTDVLNDVARQVDPEFYHQLEWPKPHDDYL